MYCLQIIETWFAKQFYASHRMGIEQICLKISAWIAWRETYQIRPLSTHLFSHWSIPLNQFYPCSHSSAGFWREMENPQGRKEDEAGSAFPGGCFSSLYPLSNAATGSKFNSVKSQAVCLCPHHRQVNLIESKMSLSKRYWPVKELCDRCFPELIAGDTVSHDGIFDPPLWAVAPLTFSLVKLSPLAGRGWGVLCPVGDHILQEFNTLILTRLRTFKMAWPRHQTKT